MADVSAVEKVFETRREYWTRWTQAMNEKVKDLQGIVDLQGEIYSRRQEAVDDYHSLAATLAKQNKDYKEKHSKVYLNVRSAKFPNSTTFLYPTDTAVRQEVDSQLSEEKYIIDIIDNHLDYLDQTIKTIDNLNFSISNRIKLEELKSGK